MLGEATMDMNTCCIYFCTGLSSFGVVGLVRSKLSTHSSLPSLHPLAVHRVRDRVTLVPRNAKPGASFYSALLSSGEQSSARSLPPPSTHLVSGLSVM